MVGETTAKGAKGAKRSATLAVVRYTISLGMLAFSCWILWLMLTDEGRDSARSLCDATLLSFICPS